jgi:hypothetical protein
VQNGVVWPKFLAFFVFAVRLRLGFTGSFDIFRSVTGLQKRISIYAVAFCFTCRMWPEEFFGIADITALPCRFHTFNTPVAEYVKEGRTMFLSDLFADLVCQHRHQTHWMDLTFPRLWFCPCILLEPSSNKFIGCGVGATFVAFAPWVRQGRPRYGITRLGRADCAQKGVAVGLLSGTMFAPVILVVIVTTLITPILLKVVYSKRWKANQVLEQPEEVAQVAFPNIDLH